MKLHLILLFLLLLSLKIIFPAAAGELSVEEGQNGCRVLRIYLMWFSFCGSAKAEVYRRKPRSLAEQKIREIVSLEFWMKRFESVSSRVQQCVGWLRHWLKYDTARALECYKTVATQHSVWQMQSFTICSSRPWRNRPMCSFNIGEISGIVWP